MSTDDSEFGFEPVQSKITVRLYRLRNTLKDKAGGVGGGELKISEDALKKAQEAFDQMAEDYPDWVLGNIKDMWGFHKKLVSDKAPPAREKVYGQIRELAHDMRGQGGTFGYPLITQFADSLYGFVSFNAGTSDNHVEIIKSHIDAMHVVIKERVKGNGGPAGKELSANLEMAIKKYTSVG